MSPLKKRRARPSASRANRRDALTSPRAERASLSTPFNTIAFGLVLVALVTVPTLSNPRSLDPFGVVKAGLIETLGVMAGASAALSLWIERRRVPINPLSIAMLAVAVASATATLVGVAPALSFSGAAARHEGTFATLALIVIAFAISTFDREQIGAALTALVLGSVGPALYQIAQAANLTAGSGAWPPPTGSTFGNPILLGGYLVMVVPVTAALALLRRGRSIYWTVLALQVTALLAVRARGAWLAAIVALVAFGLASASRSTRRHRAVAIITATCLLLAAIAVGVALRARYGTVMVGRTLQVRALIWSDVSRLIRVRTDRSTFGFGPEMLQSVVAPFRSAELGRFENEFSVPDRAHNELLDAIVSIGLIGAAAVIAAHVLLWSSLCSLLTGDRRVLPNTTWILAIGATLTIATVIASQPFWVAVLAFAGGLVVGLLFRISLTPTAGADAHGADLLVLGLLAACVAHFVEIQVGVATVPSRLVWWCCLGVTISWLGNADGQSMTDRLGATSDTPIATIGALGVAALLFGLWQPGAGLTMVAIGVVGGTATLVLALAHASEAKRLSAAQLVVATTIVTIVATIPFLCDRITESAPPIAARSVDTASWISHEATAMLMLLAVSGVFIPSLIDSRTFASNGRRQLAALGAMVLIAIASSVWIARESRADIIAQLANQLEGAGRWSEAEALEAERVRLTPESDKAWSAWGSAQLEMAKRLSESARDVSFARAASTLAEARQRNPFDWFHKRNQASVERSWAAANQMDRAKHLAAADRFYGEAAAEAPTFPRLWAEWGNVDAERGDFQSAWSKLDRAVLLDDSFGAKAVGDAILRARGVDLQDPAARARIADQFKQQQLSNLASLYAR